jgi:hypothetical protein
MSAQHPLHPQPQASGAVVALVLGILSIVLCPLCGPFAWVLGRRAEEEVRASGGALGGGGIATAGKVLGIIGSVFLVLLILGLLLVIVAGVSIEESSALSSG